MAQKINIDLDFESRFACNERQKKAFRAAMSGEYNEILYGGAYRSGKTFWLAELAKTKLILHAGCLVLLCRFFLNDLREQLWPLLVEAIPPELFAKEPRFTPTPAIELKNGAKALGLPAQRPDKIKGYNNVEMVGIDEANEVPHDFITQAHARFSQKKGDNHHPFVALTCNPAPGYLYDKYIINPNLHPKSVFFKATVWDNGAIDADDYVERMRAELTERQYKRFIEGYWGGFDNEAFPMWDEARYVKNFILDPGETWTRRQGMDYGLRNPTYIVFGAHNRRGFYYIYDEYYCTEKYPHEIAKDFKEKRERWELYDDETIVAADPSMWNRQSTTGFSPAYVMSDAVEPEYKMRLFPADNTKGIENIVWLLERNRLFIHPRCRHIRRCFAEARLMPQTPMQATQGIYAETMHPLGKDGIDAIRYWLDHTFTPDIRQNLTRQGLDRPYPIASGAYGVSVREALAARELLENDVDRQEKAAWDGFYNGF